MGVFDYIKCEYPLPDPAHQELEFQTKDVSDFPYMETYRITEAGRLIHEKVTYEEVPKEQRPYPNGPGLMAMFGAVRRIPAGDEDTNFHGSVRFYHAYIDGEVEYVALFKDGDLIDLRRAPSSAASE